jgi:hypothetical protein
VHTHCIYVEGGAELQHLATALETGGMYTLNLIDLRDHCRANFEMGGQGETEKKFPKCGLSAALL